MRLVIQRVTSSSVTIEGKGIVGAINKGLCVLIGIKEGDGPNEVEWCKKMIMTTKFWPDSEGRGWKVDLQSSDFQLLLVSQFTLYAKPYKKGRLDFHNAMASDPARTMYSNIVSEFESLLGPSRVQQGEFGAMMEVSIENDGPVTVIFDSEDS